MGLGGISIWQLLVILAIVIVAFGTKRLRNLGTDLGGAIKGFKNAMREEDTSSDETTDPSALSSRSIGKDPDEPSKPNSKQTNSTSSTDQ